MNTIEVVEIIIKTFKFFTHGATASSGPGPPRDRGFTVTLKTHHTRLDSPGQVISKT